MKYLMEKHRGQAMPSWVWVVGFVFVIVVGFYGYTQNWYAGFGMPAAVAAPTPTPTATPTPPYASPTVQAGCNPFLASQQFSVTSVDYINTGTNVVTSYSGTRDGSAKVNLAASGTAVTVTPQSAFNLIVNATGYYNAHVQGFTKCQPTDGDSAYAKMPQQGTIVTTVFNPATYNVVTAAAPVTLGVDVALNVQLQTYVSQTDRFHSNPGDLTHPGYMVYDLNFNDTCWDSAQTTLSDGTTIDRPSFINGFTQAFKIPKVLLNQKGTYTTVNGINADGTLSTTSSAIGYATVLHMQPKALSNCSGQNVTIRMADADWYANTITSAPEFGHQTNIGTDVGKTTNETVIVFTSG